MQPRLPCGNNKRKRTSTRSRFRCLCQVRNAAEYGAAALLTFPNPLKDAEDGYGAVYPDTWWMPADAERMGSILLRPGDPLTPGYPAKRTRCVPFTFVKIKINPMTGVLVSA